MRVLELQTAKEIIAAAEKAFARGAAASNPFTPFSNGGARDRKDAIHALLLTIADYFFNLPPGDSKAELAFHKYAKRSHGITLGLILDSQAPPAEREECMRIESVESFVTFLQTLQGSESVFWKAVYERLGIRPFLYPPNTPDAIRRAQTLRGRSMECESCGHEFSFSVGSGDFWYQMPNGDRFPVDSKLGWCVSCADMVAIEDLSGARANLELKKEEARIKASNDRPRTFLSKVFGANKAQHVDLDSLSRIHENLLFLARRRSPPRCLECGCSDIVELPELPWPEHVGEAIPAGWLHPVCGGRVVVTGINEQFNYPYPFKCFDENGEHMPWVRQ